jgi:8-hydroxy-5-deazaflavin:NADPH oxidoreductase
MPPRVRHDKPSREKENTMKIAFIGYGQVGGALADKLQRAGHDVVLAASDAQSESVKRAVDRNPKLRAENARQAVTTAAVVFLATPFQANAAALKSVPTPPR